MSRPDGGPAFPRHPEEVKYNGMSLRDYFAGQALAAWIAVDVDPGATDWDDAWLAIHAYRSADAMLEHRKEGEPDA